MTIIYIYIYTDSYIYYSYIYIYWKYILIIYTDDILNMIRFLHNGHHPQVWGCLTQHSQSGTGMIGGIFSCSSHWDVWQWLKLPMSRMLWQSLMMDWRNKTHRLWVILYYIILCYIMLYYMQTYGRSLIVTSFPFCFKPSSRECEHIKHAYVYIYIYYHSGIFRNTYPFIAPLSCPVTIDLHSGLLILHAWLVINLIIHSLGMINCNLATWFVPYLLLVINFTTSRYWCGISAGDTGMIPGNEAFGHLEGLHIIPIGGMHLYTQ